MATSDVLRQIARDADFQARVHYYMHLHVGTVLAEHLSTVGHDLRVAYAAEVVDGTAVVLSHATAALSVAEAAAVGNLTSVNNGIPDAILAAAVASTWNLMAGVETGASASSSPSSTPSASISASPSTSPSASVSSSPSGSPSSSPSAT